MGRLWHTAVDKQFTDATESIYQLQNPQENHINLKKWCLGTPSISKIVFTVYARVSGLIPHVKVCNLLYRKFQSKLHLDIFDSDCLNTGYVFAP